MVVRAQFIVLLFVGLAAGFGIGLLAIAPSTRVPPAPPSVDKLEMLIAAPLSVAATHVDATSPANADSPDSPANADSPDSPDSPDSADNAASLKPTPEGAAAAGQPTDEPVVQEPKTALRIADDGDPLVPSTVHKRAVFDDDITLIPRGPGRYAVLDMRPTHYKRLTIHAGALDRDGGGNFANFASRRKVGSLRGPKVRVELLHLGFDRDGIPTIAHIRPANHPSIEGIVNLRRGDRVVRVLPDRGEATSDEPF